MMERRPALAHAEFDTVGELCLRERYRWSQRDHHITFRVHASRSDRDAERELAQVWRGAWTPRMQPVTRSSIATRVRTHAGGAQASPYVVQREVATREASVARMRSIAFSRFSVELA